MNNTPLYAISPVDGRYNIKTTELKFIFSEYALIENRLHVELKWLKTISQLLNYRLDEIEDIYFNFNYQDALKIKEIEKETNHDVKAVEFFIKEHPLLQANPECKELIHFGCTSEDINNIAYAIMIEQGNDTLINQLDEIVITLSVISKQYINIPMLARTHGQPASTTSVGKEIKVFIDRLIKQVKILNSIKPCVKFNGATGNNNALYIAYPDINWDEIIKHFIKSINKHFEQTEITTQIEPQDYMVQFFDTFAHINNILTDLCIDMWGYISLNYFGQKINTREVGSSTMPHKVNPIDFENAESNFGIANALLKHFSDKLPKSRWQRDLTNSSLLRNIGVAYGHSLIGYKSLLKGLSKIELNKEIIEKDLDNHWEILAEAIQTIMRKNSIDNSYEIMKTLTRGSKITKEDLHRLINQLDINDEDKVKLLKLTPSTYVKI